jgi:hypothetical protein
LEERAHESRVFKDWHSEAKARNFCLIRENEDERAGSVKRRSIRRRSERILVFSDVRSEKMSDKEGFLWDLVGGGVGKNIIWKKSLNRIWKVFEDFRMGKGKGCGKIEKKRFKGE